MADRDTHRGELHPDGTVLAQCGIRFAPRRTTLGGVALPGHPQDRSMTEHGPVHGARPR